MRRVPVRRAGAVVLCAVVVLLARAADAQQPVNALDPKAQEFFWKGDYAKLAAVCGARSRRADATLDDHLWHGHAWQLAGEWAKAVDAYKDGLSHIERELARPERAPVQPRSGKGHPPSHDGRLRKELQENWAKLVLLIGRLELEMLNDPAAAAKTLSQGLKYADEASRPIDVMAADAAKAIAGLKRPGTSLPGDDSRLWTELMYPLTTQRYLALAHERLGTTREALECWTRIRLGKTAYRAAMARTDVMQLARLWAKLPPGAKLPSLPVFAVLTAEADTVTLRPEEGRSRLVCWSMNDWTIYALAPPPRQALAAVHIGCTVEHPGEGLLYCWVGNSGYHMQGSVRLLTHRFPDVPLDGATFSFDVEVPYDADVVFIQVIGRRGEVSVVEMKIKGTLRGRGGAPAVPEAGPRVSTQYLPEGGRRTLDGQDMPERSTPPMKPGRHVLTYTHPDHPKPFRGEFDLKNGDGFGVFVNLESPFRPALVDLPRFSELGPSRADIVGLPDGRMLMAFTTGDAWHRKVLLTTSTDGVTWDEPWELPHNGVFNTISPSMVVDDEGAVWMLYLSQRLSIEPFCSGYYHPYLTRSTDGRRWSAPRCIRAPGYAQYQNTAQLTRSPNGVWWVFQNGLVGRGKSPDDVRELHPLKLPIAENVYPNNVDAVFDRKGACHVVFDDSGQAIYYCRTRDMRMWSEPVRLEQKREGSMTSHPQLVLDGERVLFVFETTQGGWMRRGRMGREGPELGGAIQMNSHWAPLNGARVFRRGDTLFLPSGDRRPWMLRADVADAFGGGN